MNYNINGQLALSPEVQKPWLENTRRAKIEKIYKMREISETTTYARLAGAKETSKSALSTIILTVFAIVLAGIFVLRLAGIFEINKRTKQLIKQNTNLTAHLTLEENKVIGELSGRNASEIAAKSRMKKIEKSDICKVDCENTEFTRVYYNERTVAHEVEDLTLKEKIGRFLGLLKFE